VASFLGCVEGLFEQVLHKMSERVSGG